ncbi:MAG: hypothetical protein P4L76_13005 [Beijerinckiaceae bacterium]|nr:hypothetical protein [Beijerinckiaceae bacterium]
MPYLVFALGVALSICGALSIYFGYGIVEIERGWTGVIAGATALTGGIVVIALGLVIKGLGDLRATLLQAAGRGASDGVALAPTPKSERFEDAGSHSGQQTPPSATPDQTGLELEGRDERETQELQGQELQNQDLQNQELQNQETQGQDADVLAVAIATQTRLEIAESAAVPRETIDPFASHRARTSESAVRPLGQAPLFAQEALESPVPKPRQKVTLKPQVAAPRKEEPVPTPAPDPEGPSMDDWLDRAFSALDHEVASTPLRDLGTSERTWPLAGAKQQATGFAPEPLAAEPVAPHSLAQESRVPETEAVEPPAPEPAAPDQPALAAREPESAPAAPAQAAPEPTEIGRYEADGTSYIMYTDGSIDAQSDAGVFRFNSMAELRAYIEGTA